MKGGGRVRPLPQVSGLVCVDGGGGSGHYRNVVAWCRWGGGGVRPLPSFSGLVSMGRAERGVRPLPSFSGLVSMGGGGGSVRYCNLVAWCRWGGRVRLLLQFSGLVSMGGGGSVRYRHLVAWCR